MDDDPKTRSEKGKGKGRKYKNVYSRQHVENTVNAVLNNVTKKNKLNKHNKHDKQIKDKK